jgi:arginine/lysine/ornithine decarboxylase
MSIREAMLAKSETIRVDEAFGRILADAAISCPPAVPVVVSGEVIGKDEIELLKAYGVEYVKAVIE